MDGINGITGIYSLAVLLSLTYLNFEVNFINPDFLYYSILGVIVFNFFNVRERAKCFAGDVGSVSIAMIVMFSLLKLMHQTGNFAYILFLAVYGVDSILTIIHRLTKKENIFEAHRSHLYQWLVKPGPFSHLQIAFYYGMTQILINVLVIQSMSKSLTFQVSIAVSIIAVLFIFYVLVKMKYIKKYNLV
jgi:UDP-N-acetylmuramyl pentapeptide phosphotransferase/UDP-N-acetylglucosamine-1-phosphate transferase